MANYVKLAVAGLVLVVLAGTHWKVYTVGRNGERAKAVALKLEQTEKLATFNESQRHLEKERGATVIRSQNERIQKAKAAEVVSASVAAELDGLRSDIYRIDTDASGQSISACPARAATARAVFAECAERLTGVARAADGHAADSLMYQQAWPKNQTP